MKFYKRLTLKDRKKIKALLQKGLNQSEIAEKLKVNRSTISRELNRNGSKRGYYPVKAQKISDKRKNWRNS